jgi:hypothetical protein
MWNYWLYSSMKNIKNIPKSRRNKLKIFLIVVLCLTPLGLELNCFTGLSTHVLIWTLNCELMLQGSYRLPQGNLLQIKSRHLHSPFSCLPVVSVEGKAWWVRTLCHTPVECRCLHSCTQLPAYRVLGSLNNTQLKRSHLWVSLSIE